MKRQRSHSIVLFLQIKIIFPIPQSEILSYLCKYEVLICSFSSSNVLTLGSVQNRCRINSKKLFNNALHDLLRRHKETAFRN